MNYLFLYKRGIENSMDYILKYYGEIQKLGGNKLGRKNL